MYHYVAVLQSNRPTPGHLMKHYQILKWIKVTQKILAFGRIIDSFQYLTAFLEMKLSMKRPITLEGCDTYKNTGSAEVS